MEDLKKRTKDKKILIFDFDGTIALIDVDWKHYFSRLKEYFNKKDAALLKSAENYQELNEVESLYFNKYGLESRLELKEITLSIELDMAGFKPNIDLINFIEQEHSSFDDFYIWSSNHEETIVKVITQLNLQIFFHHIVSKDTVTNLKPNAEGFKHIFDGYKYQKSDYLFIGNSLHSDKGAADVINLDFYHEQYFE